MVCRWPELVVLAYTGAVLCWIQLSVLSPVYWWRNWCSQSWEAVSLLDWVGKQKEKSLCLILEPYSLVTLCSFPFKDIAAASEGPIQQCSLGILLLRCIIKYCGCLLHLSWMGLAKTEPSLFHFSDFCFVLLRSGDWLLQLCFFFLFM